MDWKKLRLEAEADVSKFQGDLDRVNAALVQEPANEALLSRRNTIATFIDSLQIGIEQMKDLENHNHGQQ
jgi:hypothetical protein